MPLFLKKRYTQNWYSSDDAFNQVYPETIQQLARRHWTPVEVARKAAGFLAAENDVRILDIGSGVGKFCLSAAYFQPNAYYIGIEQRKNLVAYADAAKELLHAEKVSFVHGNFTRLDLREFNHFYFFNSFYENLAGTDKIDDNIEYSGQLYNYYNRYLYRQLAQMPPGTRLATYHSLEDEVPCGYHEVRCEFGGLLKFWEKV